MDIRSSSGLTPGSHGARAAALRPRHANFDRQIQVPRRPPSAERESATLKVEKLRIKDDVARLTHWALREGTPPHAALAETVVGHGLTSSR